MTKKLLFLLVLFTAVSGFSQDDTRRPLSGSVIYMNIGVPNENVINSTSERATITNDQGLFRINVKVGDELVFTAVNYNIKVVTVTEEILANNRLVVEVNEKVTELDEVVITPEQQERFLAMKNEEFKQHEYEIDRSTEVENIAMSQTDRGMQDGLNFVNIFRAIFKSQDETVEEGPKLKVSEVLRQVYDDSFFVVDLQIPQDKINEFLYYCDARMPAQTLLRKENEFQLIDALVNHSKTFLKELNEE
ncbi:peptidase associated/transthyretin-like domain-containing protein [Maribacter stanieri]|jgi:hypothetical protein|uniref:CarboxypepD_reg-like domain-containing protein n=1 Tax=Maribacter stanieri TaxID=440514 RepID=A0A1I6KMN0_9FLAO|nr:hypothetical protein [Maribacter stanieri]SFR92477.1 hypothetical protein SAMN04488010_3796 [Maribacter stanieri]